MSARQRIAAAALAILAATCLAACKPGTAPPDQQFTEIIGAGEFEEVLLVEVGNVADDLQVTVWVRNPDGRSQQWGWHRDGVSPQEPQQLTFPGPGIKVTEVDLPALVSEHDRYRGDDCPEPTAHLQTSPTGRQLAWVSCGYPGRYVSGSSSVDGDPVSQDGFDLTNASDIETLAGFLPLLVDGGELIELSQAQGELAAITALAPAISLTGGYCQPQANLQATGASQGNGFPVHVSCQCRDCDQLTAQPDARPSFSLDDYEPAALVGIWEQVSAAGMTRQDVSAFSFTAGADGVLNYSVTATDPYRFGPLSGTISPR